jgi:DNA repair protein RadA/Sms
MLLAVLGRRARVPTASIEVYASAVGGVRLVEPGADLAICLALVSALAGRPLAPDLVVFGEIGLAGEVRQVSHARRRLNEAERLGFRRAIIPANSPDGAEAMSVIKVATLSEALTAAGLNGP